MEWLKEGLTAWQVGAGLDSELELGTRQALWFETKRAVLPRMFGIKWIQDCVMSGCGDRPGEMSVSRLTDRSEFLPGILTMRGSHFYGFKVSVDLGQCLPRPVGTGLACHWTPLT